MVRKRKTKPGLPPAAIKVLGISFFCLIAAGAAGYWVVSTATTSDYFRVKTIMIDPSLQVIQRNDLSAIRGQNIFTIDLKAVQKKLAYKYPEIMDLKVVRKFPNQVHLAAKKRKPLAQTVLKDRVVTLDDYGVVLSTTEAKSKKLSFIEGLKGINRPVALGEPLQGERIYTALKVLRNFNENKNLNTLDVEQVDVENLSKINLKLSNGLNVILDRTKVDEKMLILGVVMTQGQIDIKDLKYVDLRFKEPILGKK